MPGTTACTTVLLSEPTSISWPQPYTLGGPKYTLAPDLIRCPVSVSARSSPSATLLFGVTLVSVSGSVFTTNDNVFDVRAGSPAWAGRFVTITRRPPSVASADAGTVTWIWPGVAVLVGDHHLVDARAVVERDPDRPRARATAAVVVLAAMSPARQRDGRQEHRVVRAADVDEHDGGVTAIGHGHHAGQRVDRDAGWLATDREVGDRAQGDGVEDRDAADGLV